MDVSKEREGQYDDLIGQLVTSNYPGLHLVTLQDSEAGRTVLGMERSERKDFAVALMGWLGRRRMPLSKTGSGLVVTRLDISTRDMDTSVPPPEINPGFNFSELHLLRADSAVEVILRSRLPFGCEDIPGVLKWSRQANYGDVAEREAVSAVENYLRDHELTPDIEEVIRDHIEWREWRGVYDAACRRRMARLRRLVGEREALPLTGGEPWSDAAIEYVTELPERTGALWADLVRTCSLSDGPRPTATWKKESLRLVTEIGFSEVRAKLIEWFALFDRPRSAALELHSFGRGFRVHDMYVEKGNADVLKGFVWLFEGASGKETAEALAELARLAYLPVPKVGPRCAKVGNACVWVLGTMASEYSHKHLMTLRKTVRSKNAQKEIAKSIERVCHRLAT